MATKLNIQIKKIEDVHVAELAGEIDASTAKLVTDGVSPLIELGEQKVILDMTGVKYMSSAGLRLLLSLYRDSEKHHGKLILVGLADNIKETMDVTGFLAHFIENKAVSDTLINGIASLA